MISAAASAAITDGRLSRRVLPPIGEMRRINSSWVPPAVFRYQLLKVAFDEYFATVADYNQAQFQLFHALGYPASEISFLRPPGDVEPVDTTRPAYLPPVGTGPPPATR